MACARRQYDNWYKELQELDKAPVSLGPDWVEIPVRTAEQFNKCIEHGIPVRGKEIRVNNKFIRTVRYIVVKFDDILNIF